MFSKRQQAKASAEELVRTQVLNIDEVRKVVKYEKKISKKPAILCALLGAFMITVGTASQGIIILSDKLKVNQLRQNNILERQNNNAIETTIQESKAVKSSMTCQLINHGNANGTSYESYFTYNFIDGKLKSETKIFMLDKIQENPFGESAMKNLYVAYQVFEQNNGFTSGYLIKTAPREDFGFQVTTQIDLTVLNTSLVPSNYQANEQIKVDFPLDTTYEMVKSTQESLGYICNQNPKQN